YERGIYVQMNSNLTLPIDRYLDIAEYIDVMHISHNWGTIDEFTEVGFGAMEKQPRSEEHTSELQSRFDLVCCLLLEKKKPSSIDVTWEIPMLDKGDKIVATLLNI